MWGVTWGVYSHWAHGVTRVWSHGRGHMDVVTRAWSHGAWSHGAWSRGAVTWGGHVGRAALTVEDEPGHMGRGHMVGHVGRAALTVEDEPGLAEHGPLAEPVALAHAARHRALEEDRARRVHRGHACAGT
eukprot:155295-Prymnesium_polylepis.1